MAYLPDTNFKPDETGERILRLRYYHEGEDWNKLCERVSYCIAQAEKTDKLKKEWQEKFYEMINKGYVIPNTPTLKNAGTENTLTAACIVLPLYDSREGIFECLKESVLVQSRGAGVGYNFSVLRPKGCNVRKVSGKSSGAVSYMRIFDLAIGEIIRQAGVRDGAQMATFDYRHPDILNFIEAKQKETQLTHFNISILVNSEFFSKVKNDENLELWFPDYETYIDYDKEWFGDFDEWKKSNKPIKIYKIIKARELWNKIIDGMYQVGEPGIIFKDIINRDTPHPHDTVIIGVNPCLYKDTLLFDSHSLKRISSSGDSWNSWKTGIKKCIKLHTNAKHEIILTPNHKIMLEDGNFIEAKDSLNKNIKWGLGNWEKINKNNNAILQGFLFGDGFLCGRKLGVSVKLNKNKENEIYQFLINNNFHEQDSGTLYINKKQLFCDITFLDNHTFNRKLPEEILLAHKDYIGSFLCGLFEANGSVNKYGQISLKSTCRDLIEKVQIILSAFGIESWISINSSKKIVWKNGDYISKQSYNLQIAPRNANKFKEKIGFYSNLKNNKIKILNKLYYNKLKIIAIENIGEYEVWDFNNNIHYNNANGIIVHNCSEQGLPPYFVCNLISIDLSKCYEKESFNFNLLKILLEYSLRFSDNSIDISNYGLDKLNYNAQIYRNVGVGLMGWADLLIKMKLKYDSEEVLSLLKDIAIYSKDILNEYSIQLGKEKGNAKGCIRRNIAISSIQPNGTGSLILGTSSGIEPNFDFKILRKDETGEHYVYNKLAEKYYLNNKSLPNYFSIANNISYLWHLKHLEYWQKYFSENGIAKTINMSENCSKKDIENALWYAYNTNIIKAFTVYRDKSRNLQVLNKIETKKSNPIKNINENRPDRMLGYTEKIPTGNGNLYMTITKELNHEDYWNIRNLLKKNGIIREVFFHFGKHGTEQAGFFEAIGRMISVSLRKYNIPIKEIIKQLKGISFLPSWYKGKLNLSPIDAVAKALEREIKNDEEKQIEFFVESKIENVVDKTNFALNDICPICGEKFKRIEGCKQCLCGSLCE